MKKLIILQSIIILMLSSCDLFNTGIPEFIAAHGNPITQRVATPVINSRGDFSKWIIIDFTSTTEGVRFYYTTEADTPTPTRESTEAKNGRLRLNDIDSESSYTVKVIGVKNGWLDSKVESVLFTNTQVATPEIKYTGNNTAFDFAEEISFTSSTSGTSLYYTTDDTVPTSESLSATSINLHTLGLTSPVIINVITVKDAVFTSIVERRVFTKGKVATPVITGVLSGNDDKLVSLSCSTLDAQIYYTINGDDPTTAVTESNKLYTGGQFTIPIEFPPVNVKARAVKGEMIPSNIASVLITKHVDSGRVESKDSIFPIGSDRVTFSYNFSMGKTEVTQGQYYDVMTSLLGATGEAGSRRPSNNTTGDWRNLPVEQVSWYDAVRFCNALSVAEGLTPYYTITGGNPSDERNNPPTVEIADMQGVFNNSGVGPGVGYRLPTAVEWEYVAGGGSGTRTTWAGTSVEADLEDYAWYDNKGGSVTKPVKTKDPNALGMYDMTGNVSEWCGDWATDTYPSANQDPTGPSTGTHRVRRGGGYNSGANDSRVVTSNYSSPSFRRNVGLGFRVARTLTP